ncbi:MAG: hypothetical protein OEQ18_12710 [Gammaproteobacteria bacterium]|nr:hypothetical protein [Gammaproteobacteria bacterium]
MFTKFYLGGKRDTESHSVLAQTARARHWLDNLPLLNPVEAVARMHKALAALSSTKLGAEQRLEILELVHQTVGTVANQVIERRAGASLPLSKTHQDSTDLVASLHRAMVTGYSQVSESFETRKIGKRRDSNSHALSLHRALFYLNEQYLECYRIYQPIETGMWQLVHQIIQTALAHKLTQIPLTHAGSERIEQGILDLYKRMLLVALANPYQLAPTMVDKTYTRSAGWAPMVGLRKQGDEKTARCKFIVDLGADWPARFVHESQRPKHSGACLILDTSKLVIALYQHIRELERRMSPVKNTDQVAVERDECQFIQQLIVHWGGKARRIGNRTMPSDNREVVIGLDPINFFLNGEQLFQPSGLQKIKPVTGTFGYQQLQVKRHAVDVDWVCLDESRAGMQLTKQDTGSTRIRVGELVAIRRSGKSNAWDVGVIRWVRNQRPNTISFGMYKLAPVACAAAVQDEYPGRGYHQCLVLPKITAKARCHSMVTPRGVFSTEKELLLHTSDEVQRVSLSRLVMATFSFEWFEYEPVSKKSLFPFQTDEILMESASA